MVMFEAFDNFRSKQYLNLLPPRRTPIQLSNPMSLRHERRLGRDGPHGPIAGRASPSCWLQDRESAFLTAQTTNLDGQLKDCAPP
jgi:hypothetical protein